MTEKDHIFPKSEVSTYRVDNRGRRVYVRKQYDSIVNCEMLTGEENREKTDLLPEEYFEVLREKGKLPDFLKLHRIPEPQDGAINIWNIYFFREFLEQRRGWIRGNIQDNLQGLVNIGGRRRRTTIEDRKSVV